MGARFGIGVVLLCVATGGRADPPRTLRIATVIPEGTAWAREMHAFAHELEATTDGHVGLKLFFGGIAGDEVRAAERVAREQLDGVGSAGMLCQRIVPTMRVLMMPGLFRSRDEAEHVLHLLKPTMAAEAHAVGYELLATSGLGPVLLFSRTPVHTFEELKAMRLWIWDLDQFADSLRALGLHIVPSPIDDALRAYDEQRVDGFLAIPTGALAFHWSAHAKYLTDLRTRYLSACLLVSTRAFDRLSYPEQQALRAAAAALDRGFERVNGDWDRQLLGGLFHKQGLVPVPPSEDLRDEYFAAALRAREHLDPKLVPPELLARVVTAINEYRNQHTTR